MHIFFSAAIIFLVGVLHASPVWCHGVEGYVEAGQGYRIVASYDDGEPMSYAAVEVKSPDSEIAFQSGRTDRNGVMMFLPDRPGRWQAVVSDGMGHRLALSFEVADMRAADSGAHGAPAAVTRRPGKIQDLITGVAIIFGFFGALYGWTARRQHGHRPTPAATAQRVVADPKAQNEDLHG